jgi:hypothetical protein
VRARDRVGNWSNWVAGPTVVGRVLQETSSSALWSSGWTTISSSALSGGAAKTTDLPTATVKLRATATSLAIVGRKGPGRGLARIYVDGAFVATIDLEAAALGARQVLFARSWSSQAIRTIELRNLGTLSRPMVEADAFLWVR